MACKRILMCVLLGSMAAVAFAVPAQAQVSHTMNTACTIEGSATASVAWQDLGGTFSFGSLGLGIFCVFVTKKNIGLSKGVGNVEAGVADVFGGSAGSFDNILCGTGLAADDNPTVSSVVTTPDSPNAEARLLGADLGYHIWFNGYEGVLTWGDDAAPGFPDPNVVPTQTEPVGGGVINISPWRRPDTPLSPQWGTFPGDPLDPFGECTNGFNVLGTVGGTLTW